MGTPPDYPQPINRNTLGLSWFNYRGSIWLGLVTVVLTWIDYTQNGLKWISTLVKPDIKNYAPLKATLSAISEHKLHAGQEVLILLILGLSIFSLFKKPYPDQLEDAIAVIAARRFFWWWICLVLSWGLLFGVECLLPESQLPRSIKDISRVAV